MSVSHRLLPSGGGGGYPACLGWFFCSLARLIVAGSLPGKRFVFLLQLKNTSCCGQKNVFEMGGSRRVGSRDGGGYGGGGLWRRSVSQWG